LSLDYSTNAEAAYQNVLVPFEILCYNRNKAEPLPTLKASHNDTVSEEGQKVRTGAGYPQLPAEIAAKGHTPPGAQEGPGPQQRLPPRGPRLQRALPRLRHHPP
ncbi:hypothetical protein ADL06_13745, partial [Streptomyces sp. NRRL F-6491]